MRQSNKKTSRGEMILLFTVNGQAAFYFFIHSGAAARFVLEMLCQCGPLERLSRFETLHFITADTLTLPGPDVL